MCSKNSTANNKFAVPLCPCPWWHQCLLYHSSTGRNTGNQKVSITAYYFMSPSNLMGVGRIIMEINALVVTKLVGKKLRCPYLPTVSQEIQCFLFAIICKSLPNNLWRWQFKNCLSGTNLEPVNCTAVDEWRILSQAVTECAADRAECNDDVQVFTATTDKVRIDGQRRQLGVLAGWFGMHQDCLVTTVTHSISQNTAQWSQRQWKGRRCRRRRERWRWRRRQRRWVFLLHQLHNRTSAD